MIKTLLTLFVRSTRASLFFPRLLGDASGSWVSSRHDYPTSKVFGFFVREALDSMSNFLSPPLFGTTH
jgi:hypothetical protein